MTTDASMLEFVRKSLGLEGSAPLTMKIIYQGGSDRTFCRLGLPGGESVILIRYNPERRENRFYVTIAAFLRRADIAVPRIFGHDPSRALILMEDLGDTSLESLQGAPWELRRLLYMKTLALARRLHAYPLEDFPAKDVPLMEPFGPALYLWERNYFRENFVQALCRIDAATAFDPKLEEELSGLAGRLCTERGCLVHRDFQSRNVMIRDGEPVLIDFQGMRFGNLHYDLGSLLCDPYVKWSQGERRELLSHYFGLAGLPHGNREEFERMFWQASAQRLMQALGAFGFLFLKKGLGGFAEHVPAGLENLISAADRAGTLPHLTELALKCRLSLQKKGLPQT